MIARAVGLYFASALVLGSGVRGCDAACHLAVASGAVLPGLGFVYAKSGALSGGHCSRFWSMVLYLAACAPLWFFIGFWVPNALSANLASNKSFIEHLALYLGLTGLWILGISHLWDQAMDRPA